MTDQLEALERYDEEANPQSAAAKHGEAVRRALEGANQEVICHHCGKGKPTQAQISEILALFC